MKKLTRHTPRFKGITLGLDLHQRFIQVCWLDEQGDERANHRLPATPQALRELIQQALDQDQPVQAVLEASGCFLWAFDLLVELLGRDRV